MPYERVPAYGEFAIAMAAASADGLSAYQARSGSRMRHAGRGEYEYMGFYSSLSKPSMLCHPPTAPTHDFERNGSIWLECPLRRKAALKDVVHCGIGAECASARARGRRS
jgi:hypothetical protein